MDNKDMERNRKKPIAYVFGYGSLMYPSGINGRGMRHRYVWKDLLPVEIVGYIRGMFAAYARRTFYGLMANSSKTAHGVLVPIFSKRDLNALWLNEGAHECYRNTRGGVMYEVKDVSTNIWPTNCVHDTPIFTLTNVEDKGRYGITPPWYIAHVWKGIEPWGTEFRQRFMDTGGIKPNRAAEMSGSVYDLCKSSRRIWRNVLRIS